MKESQRMRILDYCAEHGSITNRDAVVLLDINSPTKRISELRKAGYDVQTVEEVKINGKGRKVKFYRYFISEPSGGDQT